MAMSHGGSQGDRESLTHWYHVQVIRWYWWDRADVSDSQATKYMDGVKSLKMSAQVFFVYLKNLLF